jgi:integrase
MARTEPPTVVEKPVPVLSFDEIRALLKACETNNPFESARDEAIIRMFLDTGIRLGEMTGLKMSDLDLKLHVAIVMGKGSRFRTVPFDVRTAGVLDRYRRRRLRHKYADSESLWLGVKGPLSDSGITQIIRRRSADAGLPRIHPHQFRHTFAHQWLSMGGNEGDLQRIAGWSSPQMLVRYGASAAEERAQQAHRRLGLWDDL